jgi:hypothetical protein
VPSTLRKVEHGVHIGVTILDGTLDELIAEARIRQHGLPYSGWRSRIPMPRSPLKMNSMPSSSRAF